MLQPPRTCLDRRVFGGLRCQRSADDDQRPATLPNTPNQHGRGAMSAERAKRTIVHLQTLLAFVAMSVLAPTAAGADRNDVTIERDLRVKMRDGITLRADVCRPKADGKFPVLLTRTPYDKNGVIDFCVKAATRGYVVVAQDVRADMPRRASGIPSSMNLRTVTTPWSGQLRFPIQTERWGCSVAPTWAQPST